MRRTFKIGNLFWDTFLKQYCIIISKPYRKKNFFNDEIQDCLILNPKKPTKKIVSFSIDYIDRRFKNPK